MTLTMSVRWDHKPLNHFDAAKIFVAWADDVGPLVLTELKARTPVRTGRMRSSTRYSRAKSSGIRLEFTVHTKYAEWVIGGAEPHIIRAVAARALHWTNGSGSHFARVVHHPGNKANNYPKVVLDSVKDEVIANLKNRIDSALRGDS